MSKKRGALPRSQIEKDLAHLVLFIGEADRLHTLALSRTSILDDVHGDHIQALASINQGASLTQALPGPDEELLRSYLLTFRKFLAKSESSEFNRICNCLARNLVRSPDQFAKVAQIRNEWKRESTQQGALTTPERHYSSLDLFNLLINGYYFHSDEGARQIWESFDSNTRHIIRLNLGWFCRIGTHLVDRLGGVARSTVAVLDAKKTNEG